MGGMLCQSEVLCIIYDLIEHLAGAAEAVPEGVAGCAVLVGVRRDVATLLRAAVAIAEQRGQAVGTRGLGGRLALGRRLHLIRLAVVAVRQLRACTYQKYVRIIYNAKGLARPLPAAFSTQSKLSEKHGYKEDVPLLHYRSLFSVQSKCPTPGRTL